MARGFQYAPGASDEVERARQPVVHKADLAALGQSKNAVVREAVASRADIPIGLMATLAHDRTLDVRVALAANSAVTHPVLEHLATDRHIEVVVAVLGNPAADSALVERLAFHKKPAVRAAASARLNEPRPTQAAAPPQRFITRDTPSADGSGAVLRFPDGAEVTRDATPAVPQHPTGTSGF
ncbi:hypothetical protein [Demequina flava]|uniref:variant leucine-rich repeat-containing protein n=1 Tax=Demequina flava TaxID=1095025 RepID=UPI00078492B9|nr:hypothetical protein [Demequina flava]